MRCDYYIGREKSCSVEMQVKEAFVCIERARIKARREVVKTDKPHVLFAIHHYAEDAELERVEIYSNMSLSDEELDNMTAMHPGAYFDVLHTDTCKKACQKLIERERSREIRPLTLKEANAFVNTYHRHHSGTVGCKFAIGLFEGGKMIGAAICGRPVSRYLDNGEICEINRLCTTGGHNACSQLYGACARIAKEMGYKKIITYILESEPGTSLKASNFVCEGIAGGTHWSGERNRGQKIPFEMKSRWSRTLS